jgi:hypothetical protein
MSFTTKLQQLFTRPRVPFGLFFIGVVLAAAVGYAAVEIEQYAPPPVAISSAHFAVGDTIEADGVAVSVENFRYDTTGYPGFTPMPGYEFLIPTVDITNDLATNLELIPLVYFYVKDSAGNVYHVTAVPTATDQLTGPILPGEKVREEIGFEVPLGIDHPALYFERGTVGHPVIAIDLTTSTPVSAAAP